MSLRLKRSTATRCVGTLVATTLVVTLAAVALLLVMLALFPAAAEAQTENTSASSVVVRPGDSLWSISQERLGPNATPQQIADGAERIYALNRERIGADPNLIFVGQELLVPPEVAGPVVGEPSRVEVPRAQPSTGAPPARPTKDEPAKEAGKSVETPEPAKAQPAKAQSVKLPDAPAAESFAQPLAGVRADGGRLPGLVILLLSGLVIGTFCSWVPRAAARRKARKRELRFREEYGWPYAALDPFSSQEYASRPATEVSRPTTPSSGVSTHGGAASEERFARVGLFAIARAKRERVRRRQPLGLRRPPRRHRARGVGKKPEIRSYLERQVPTLSQRRSLRGRTRRAAASTAVATMAVAAAKGLQQAQGHEEWEPEAALKNTLQELSLAPKPGQGEDLTRLKPHLEEALAVLAGLERQRNLSARERIRAEALRMLVSATREVQ